MGENDDSVSTVTLSNAPEEIFEDTHQVCVEIVETVLDPILEHHSHSQLDGPHSLLVHLCIEFLFLAQSLIDDIFIDSRCISA